MFKEFSPDTPLHIFVSEYNNLWSIYEEQITGNTHDIWMQLVPKNTDFMGDMKNGKHESR